MLTNSKHVTTLCGSSYNRLGFIGESETNMWITQDKKLVKWESWLLKPGSLAPKATPLIKHLAMLTCLVVNAAGLLPQLPRGKGALGSLTGMAPICLHLCHHVVWWICWQLLLILWLLTLTLWIHCSLPFKGCCLGGPIYIPKTSLLKLELLPCAFDSPLPRWLKPGWWHSHLMTLFSALPSRVCTARHCSGCKIGGQFSPTTRTPK